MCHIYSSAGSHIHRSRNRILGHVKKVLSLDPPQCIDINGVINGVRCLKHMGLWGKMGASVATMAVVLLPILFAVAVWGSQWQGRLVRCSCDIMAVVSVVNSGYSKDTTMMHLLSILWGTLLSRCLYIIMGAHFQAQIKVVHTAGATCVEGKVLSYKNRVQFLQVCPEATLVLARIPHAGTGVLVIRNHHTIPPVLYK